MNTDPYPPRPRKSLYPVYVLILCLLVYISSTADRQILSVLAQAVKHDLGVSDADMGFLLGTSFAVFYAVFGIPAGRLGDLWSRRRLVAIGLSMWSAFTALSGLSRSFGQLAACRIGVGVGESTSSPSIYSILYGYFGSKWRSTAFSIYSSGVFIGAGLGMIVGGVVADGWTQRFGSAQAAPFGLAGWQVAFLMVSAPGILIALAFSRLRESPRGVERVAALTKMPVLSALSMVPGVSLVVIGTVGGIRAVALNAAILLLCAAIADLMYWLTHDAIQWSVLCFGVYCVGSAAQVLFQMDREAFRHVIASRAMVVGNLGVAGCVFLTTGLLAWLPSLLQRNFGVSAAQAGTFLGASYAITGLAGSVTGGLLSDALAVRFGAKSRLLVAMIAYIFGASLTVALVLCKQVVTAYALCVPLQFAGAMYLGPCAANVNSLVPQRLRATASAFYIATLVFLGSALGPYVIGKLSDQFAHQGVATGHALQLAVKWSLLSGIPTIALLTLGIAWISPVDEFDVAD